MFKQQQVTYLTDEGRAEIQVRQQQHAYQLPQQYEQFAEAQFHELDDKSSQSKNSSQIQDNNDNYRKQKHFKNWRYQFEESKHSNNPIVQKISVSRLDIEITTKITSIDKELIQLLDFDKLKQEIWQRYDKIVLSLKQKLDQLKHEEEGEINDEDSPNIAIAQKIVPADKGQLIQEKDSNLYQLHRQPYEDRRIKNSRTTQQIKQPLRMKSVKQFKEEIDRNEQVNSKLQSMRQYVESFDEKWKLSTLLAQQQQKQLDERQKQNAQKAMDQKNRLDTLQTKREEMLKKQAQSILEQKKEFDELKRKQAQLALDQQKECEKLEEKHAQLNQGVQMEHDELQKQVTQLTVDQQFRQELDKQNSEQQREATQQQLEQQQNLLVKQIEVFKLQIAELSAYLAPNKL